MVLGGVVLAAFAVKPAIPYSIFFTDVTSASGLHSRQSYGDHHLDNIVEGTGTGVCVFDYNNDGFLDVYFPNGKWTEGLSDTDSPEPNRGSQSLSENIPCNRVVGPVRREGAPFPQIA